MWQGVHVYPESNYEVASLLPAVWAPRVKLRLSGLCVKPFTHWILSLALIISSNLTFPCFILLEQAA